MSYTEYSYLLLKLVGATDKEIIDSLEEKALDGYVLKAVETHGNEKTFYLLKTWVVSY